MEFKEAYLEFCKEGAYKFHKRSVRHLEDDVVKFGTKGLVLQDIKGKFFEELAELLESNLESVEEAVDVHNMAFLLWWLEKEKI